MKSEDSKSQIIIERTDPKNIIIFDTTLRDGEQSLAASLSTKDKLQVAEVIDQLGVDVMEVGFPISSPAEFESVRLISQLIKNTTICGLARTLEKDIDACALALKGAERSRIHCFVSTSAIHVEQKLRKSWEDVLEMAVNGVKYARNFSDDVEFSCEDAGRTSLENLYSIIEAVIRAGARTINIPDTVGYTLPSEYGQIIANIKNNVPNIDKAVLSVHCHNDLGLAVANSLAGIQNGARQVECTINGIGERAGNCSLEEIVMTLETRKDLLGAQTEVNTSLLYPASKLVSQVCNMPVQANKAIVGKNAFSHSSGIHQDGVLKNKLTYEIMSPQTVGVPEASLNMTSRSGRHVIAHRLNLLGFDPDTYSLDDIYKRFLELADKKGQVYDYDLDALILMDQLEKDEICRLESLIVTSNSDKPTAAVVTINLEGLVIEEVSGGNGPVDAAYNAIDRVTNFKLEVEDYKIAAKGSGRNTLGQVDIIVNHHGKRFHGMGLSVDIVEASAKAYVHAINLVLRADKIELLKTRNINRLCEKSGAV